MDDRNKKNFFYILAVLYTIACWSNINSGFWGIRSWNHGISGFVFAVRSAVPLILIPIGMISFFVQDKKYRLSYNPVWWLHIYGLIALASSLLSPRPWVAGYWAVTFLVALYLPAVFCLNKFSKDNHPEVAMIYTLWAILAVYIVAIYIFFGNDILVEREILTKSSGSATTMIRSSGLGRFYGVFAIILAAWVLHSKNRKSLLLIIPMLISLWVVWNAQSRGAIFALIAGMGSLIFSTRLKGLFTLLLIVALGVSFLASKVIGDKFEEYIISHIERGQSSQEFRSMTGRTRAYAKAFIEIQKTPLLGRGNWSDRMLIKEHVHNSYLYAIMTAGLLGIIPYCISWIVALGLIVYIYIRINKLSLRQQIIFLQCAGVTIFFFVRAIPEVTTAIFCVDQLIMMPVFYYLFITYLRIKEVEECLKTQEISTP